MISVLVTGAGGQLGKTIKALFSKNNYNLNVVFVTKEELDITNSESTHVFFLNNKFDYCINCAAYTNVEQAEKTPLAGLSGTCHCGWVLWLYLVADRGRPELQLALGKNPELHFPLPRRSGTLGRKPADPRACRNDPH